MNDATLIWVGAAFVVLIVLALILARRDRSRNEFTGGREPRRTRESAHVVVDALNVTHWLFPGEITRKKIVDMIDYVSPQLVKRWTGRVMFVVKDRESRFNDEDSLIDYATAAKRNGVYVTLAERYQAPPSGNGPPTDEHSALGRDDFYMSLLASRYKCPVITGDRLRDFDLLRSSVPPFIVREYAYWRDAPVRDYVRPGSGAYVRLRKPRIIFPDEAIRAPDDGSHPGPR